MRRPPLILPMAALILLVFSGCLGKVPARESYLRLTPPACQERSGSAAAAAALRGLDALPALDRQAVMFGRGPVFEASPDLYWEGTPAEIASNALSVALACRGVDTARPAARRTDWTVSGRILSFEVQLEGQLRFEAAVEVEVAGTGRAVARRSFRTVEPLGGTGGREIARAAETALAAIVSQAASWAAEAVHGR